MGRIRRIKDRDGKPKLKRVAERNGERSGMRSRWRILGVMETAGEGGGVGEQNCGDVKRGGSGKEAEVEEEGRRERLGIELAMECSWNVSAHRPTIR